MIKRSTFLARRDDRSPDDFRAHWEIVHGPIAARFTGLRGYNQNHVVQRLTHSAEPRYFLDGIVELWFDDALGGDAGRDPEVTAELVVDEPLFLRGLTGARVEPSAIYPASPHKIWIVGRCADDVRGDAALEAMAADLAERVPGATAALTQSAVAGTEFTRAALEVDPAPPTAALIVCFGDTHPSGVARDRMLNAAQSASSPLRDVETVLVREVRIA